METNLLYSPESSLSPNSLTICILSAHNQGVNQTPIQTILLGANSADLLIIVSPLCFLWLFSINTNPASFRSSFALLNAYKIGIQLSAMNFISLSWRIFPDKPCSTVYQNFFCIASIFTFYVLKRIVYISLFSKTFTSQPVSSLIVLWGIFDFHHPYFSLYNTSYKLNSN